MIRLKGFITEDGQLQVDLPEGLPPGEVEITLDLSTMDWESRPWTKVEIDELMQPDLKTGSEIVAMLQVMGGEGWDHIQDGAAWVEQQRRQQREASQW